MFQVALVLGILLAATLAVAGVVIWRTRRPAAHPMHEIVEPRRLGAAGLGTQATLLQFSRRTCTSSPHAHHTLRAIADEADGVMHLDIDVTDRADIARHFHVRQTPTTLILDRRGVVQSRIGGAPGPDVVRLELTRVSATGDAA